MPLEGFFNIFESKHRDYFFGPVSAHMYPGVIKLDDISVADSIDFCQRYNTAGSRYPVVTLVLYYGHRLIVPVTNVPGSSFSKLLQENG